MSRSKVIKEFFAVNFIAFDIKVVSENGRFNHNVVKSNGSSTPFTTTRTSWFEIHTICGVCNVEFSFFSRLPLSFSETHSRAPQPGQTRAHPPFRLVVRFIRGVSRSPSTSLLLYVE